MEPVTPQILNPPSRLDEFTSKVFEVAKTIIKVVACLFLYYMNPTLFAVGFVLGALYPKKMEETVEKINKIFEDSKKIFPLMLVIGFGALLSLPVFLATASVLMGGYAGSQFVKEHKSILPDY